MATEILMPALSPTMEEGTLAKWLVKEGDTVSSGDILAEIETDKATMEFEAVDEGVVGKILVAEGTAGVKVNTAIAIMLEDGESADALPTAKAAQPEAKAETKPDTKLTGAAPAPTAAAAPVASGARIVASPLARRLAKEKGVDLAALAGSGPHGRIVKADVEAASSAPTAAQTTVAPAPVSASESTATMPVSMAASTVAKIYEGRKYEEVPLDGMRKIIAARLTEAKQTIPHFYLR
ncbi:MAG: biotin/lipoyl-containing protein, partial [Albidovulum sp.]